ncbi:A1S_2505 family phage non-structural protein [Microbacterium arborescens]
MKCFVLGSNAAGAHGAGAARTAWKKFGAVWGEGHGHHGQSYAIDTMSGPTVLATEVAQFCDYARQRPDLTFLVTEVGCGIAGYSPGEVAPLFRDAPANVELPESFARP